VQSAAPVQVGCPTGQDPAGFFVGALVEDPEGFLVGALVAGTADLLGDLLGLFEGEVLGAEVAFLLYL